MIVLIQTNHYQKHFSLKFKKVLTKLKPPNMWHWNGIYYFAPLKGYALYNARIYKTINFFYEAVMNFTLKILLI